MPSVTQKMDQAIAYTAIANNQTISGGQLVKAMSVAVVANTLANLEVDLADAAGDGVLTVGIALTNAASGETLTVAQEGVYLLPATAAISAGQAVRPAEADSGSSVAVAGAAFQAAGSRIIGVALSTAAAAQNVAVSLRI